MTKVNTNRLLNNCSSFNWQDDTRIYTLSEKNTTIQISHDPTLHPTAPSAHTHRHPDHVVGMGG
jgi:hypothetical protein